MNELYIYLGIMIVGVAIAAFSQLLLKQAANREYSSILRQYLNPRVIIAYGMLFLSTIASLIAFRVVPLSYAPVADACGQIFTVTLSVLVLKEKLTIKKVIGLFIILAGILIIAL